MTAEIKEILQEVNKIVDNTLYNEDITYFEVSHISKLLDYITNLQQLYENGLKVNQNSHKYITELEMNNEILKEDLDKANDIIEKDRQFYKCRMDEYAELKKENKRLKEIIKDNTILVKDENGNYQECNINPLDYKSRCEKANDFIDNYDVFKEFSFPLMKRDIENQIKSSIDYEFNFTFRKKLKNILNGSDENELELKESGNNE